ncbi:LOW QUALITY PROTEIN: hypothetical protein PHMEG_00011047 [Phytophthora megakarya]|uniref:Uncharacterized protein n=1 Tax=Phytophthora megakarya TaxID=4795 RepID=A0A225WDL6_9STRA|nr:LOW QUALITY PROTEIN: hypothetical protein PHMEG_00011047 [Phytophthora megakarya]
MGRGRKRAPGGRGRRPSDYNRDCETFGKKLDVINFHLERGMKATLEKFFISLTPAGLEEKVNFRVAK